MVKVTRQNRKKIALQYLGGECVNCGSIARLEFDHIDPSTVSFRIGANLNCAFDKLIQELNKCQLLCKPCHQEKTNLENAFLKENDHGTPSCYSNYGCRCELCKSAYSTYQSKKVIRKRLVVRNQRLFA